MTLKPLTEKFAERIPTKTHGVRIKYWRLRRGMTKVEFAKCVGLSSQQIWLIEKGGSGTTQKRLSKIARVLKVHKEDLMK